MTNIVSAIGTVMGLGDEGFGEVTAGIHSLGERRNIAQLMEGTNQAIKTSPTGIGQL